MFRGVCIYLGLSTQMVAFSKA